jgi:hypothetical protein
MTWFLKASDDFNRADENPLGNGNWMAITGWNPMQISFNVATKTVDSAQNGSYYSGGSAFGNDQYCEAVRSGVGFVGLLLRINGGNNGYQLSVEDDSNVGYIYRIDGGVGTQIGASFIYNNPFGETLRFEIVGTTLNVYSNGVLLATRTDATYASGRPGISQYNSSATLDNFAAGDDGIPAATSQRFSGFVS